MGYAKAQPFIHPNMMKRASTRKFVSSAASVAAAAQSMLSAMVTPRGADSDGAGRRPAGQQ
jgi:hypothetical protein